MIRILIADDQKLIRDGIQALLTDYTELEIVGTAENGLETIKQIEILQPDLVLLDIEMPFANGITICNQISLQFDNIKTIILSSHEKKKYIREAIKAGAKGYLLKNTSAEELGRVIHLVYQGYSIFESQLLEKLVKKNINSSAVNPQESASSTKKRQQQALTSESSYVVLPRMTGEMEKLPTWRNDVSSQSSKNNQTDVLQMWIFALAVLSVSLILFLVILLYS